MSMRPLLLAAAILAFVPALRAEEARAPADGERERAAALAAECERGAAIPLDPLAKAPPVQYLELFPADFIMAPVEKLAATCAAAYQAATGDERLRLMALRTTAAASFDRPLAPLVPAVRDLAANGSAEANYLLYAFYLAPERAGEVEGAHHGIDREEAVAGLLAAAEAGHQSALLAVLEEARNGPVLRRDAAEAVRAARRLESLPQQGPQPGASESEARARGAGMLTYLLVVSDGLATSDYEEGFRRASAGAALAPQDFAFLLAVATRMGRGTAADLPKARAMFEAEIAADRWFGAAFLAEMLANGAGGAADPKRALALLRDERARYGFRVPQTLAQLLLDNRFVGPDPHQAARLLAGSGDIDAAIAAVPLLVDYGTALRDPARFLKRLSDAAAAGEPGAAMALARLRVAPGSPLADMAEGRRWLRALAEAGDPDAAFLLAATQFANLDTQSSQPYRRDDDGPSDDAIRKLIDDGIAAKRADAFLLRAKLLRRGVLYPQDNRAATLELINAANLGSLEAMLLLGEAYDDGLGTPKDPRERLRAWREAAKHGSLEARRRIATAFSFDTFDKLITLREGVSERIALLNLDAGRGGPGMPAGIAATMGVAGPFSGGRAADAGVPALAGAVLDGYRIAPSGLDEAVLVPTLKAFPAEIRLAMEAALHRDGFLKRPPDGYFGPDARDALRAFVDARGPLPSLEATAVPAAAVDASGTTLDPALVDRVRDDTFRRAQQVKTKAERTAVIRQLNLLAAYGDVASRWAILRNYHQADFVRNNVSAGEATRYGLDILVGRPAGVEKADFEFIFVVTQIESDGEIEAFGTATLGAIRDDPRLRDPLTLGSVLQTLLFAPGACDALLAAARSAGIDGLGSDGCDEASKAALVAFAEARGPSGVDAKARAAAATAIAALDAGR